jgi:putative FmdB family regulatory protein
MPIYEYACPHCGEVSEFILPTEHNAEELACPECGSGELQKRISLPGGITIGSSRQPGSTCCGRDERCDSPPCSTGDQCRKD